MSRKEQTSNFYLPATFKATVTAVIENLHKLLQASTSSSESKSLSLQETSEWKEIEEFSTDADIQIIQRLYNIIVLAQIFFQEIEKVSSLTGLLSIANAKRALRLKKQFSALDKEWCPEVKGKWSCQAAMLYLEFVDQILDSEKNFPSTTEELNPELNFFKLLHTPILYNVFYITEIDINFYYDVALMKMRCLENIHKTQYKFLEEKEQFFIDMYRHIRSAGFLCVQKKADLMALSNVLKNINDDIYQLKRYTSPLLPIANHHIDYLKLKLQILTLPGEKSLKEAEQVLDKYGELGVTNVGSYTDSTAQQMVCWVASDSQYVHVNLQKICPDAKPGRELSKQQLIVLKTFIQIYNAKHAKLDKTAECLEKLLKVKSALEDKISKAQAYTDKKSEQLVEKDTQLEVGDIKPQTSLKDIIPTQAIKLPIIQEPTTEQKIDLPTFIETVTKRITTLNEARIVIEKINLLTSLHLAFKNNNFSDISELSASEQEAELYGVTLSQLQQIQSSITQKKATQDSYALTQAFYWSKDFLTSFIAPSAPTIISQYLEHHHQQLAKMLKQAEFSDEFKQDAQRYLQQETAESSFKSLDNFLARQQSVEQLQLVELQLRSMQLFCENPETSDAKTETQQQSTLNHDTKSMEIPTLQKLHVDLEHRQRTICDKIFYPITKNLAILNRCSNILEVMSNTGGDSDLASQARRISPKYTEVTAKLNHLQAEHTIENKCITELLSLIANLQTFESKLKDHIKLLAESKDTLEKGDGFYVHSYQENINLLDSWTKTIEIINNKAAAHPLWANTMVRYAENLSTKLKILKKDYDENSYAWQEDRPMTRVYGLISDQKLCEQNFQFNKLPGLNLIGIQLERCNLKYANLRGAKFTNCSMSNSQLAYANICDADLRLCQIDAKTTMKGIIINEHTQLSPQLKQKIIFDHFADLTCKQNTLTDLLTKIESSADEKTQEPVSSPVSSRLILDILTAINQQSSPANVGSAAYNAHLQHQKQRALFTIDLLLPRLTTLSEIVVIANACVAMQNNPNNDYQFICSKRGGAWRQNSLSTYFRYGVTHTFEEIIIKLNQRITHLQSKSSLTAPTEAEAKTIRNIKKAMPRGLCQSVATLFACNSSRSPQRQNEADLQTDKSALIPRNDGLTP